MIKIAAPKGFESEKEYIFEELFKQFLGVEYQLEFSSSVKEYRIEAGDGLLTVSDGFWGSLKSEYLSEKNLPSDIKTISTKVRDEHDLVAIYGNGLVNVGAGKIDCNVDLFASAFFMLSRWEEYVVGKRDSRERFEGSESVAYKNGFLERPVVNEYIEFLWDALVHLGYKGKRKIHKYKVIPTHDIDHLSKWRDFGSALKVGISDLMKGRVLGLFSNPLLYLLSRFGILRDPFNTHKKLMEISERYGLKSKFFLLVGGKSVYDNGFNWDRELLKEYVSFVKKRSHNIGLHASYDSYKDGSAYRKELDFLNSVLSSPATSSRNHFLRFQIPESYSIFKGSSTTTDYSLGYHDQVGFRAGVCYEFRPFDFLSKSTLKITEKPLLVMDGTLLHHRKYSKEEAYKKTCEIVDQVKKYGGNFIILWHNSSFNTPEWKKYRNLYEKILSYAA